MRSLSVRTRPVNILKLRRTSSNARLARKRTLKYTRVIVNHYGGPDVLQVLEEECPEPKDDEVRVRMLAAGVSLPDLMMCEGIHPGRLIFLNRKWRLHRLIFLHWKWRLP